MTVDAPSQRLQNTELDADGVFHYSWFDRNGHEHSDRIDLDSMIGLANGLVEIPGHGFFTTTMIKPGTIDLASYSTSIMIYQARPSKKTKGFRWFSFDLAKLLCMDDNGDIRQRTPDELKANISSDTTTLLPVNRVPQGQGQGTASENPTKTVDEPAKPSSDKQEGGPGGAVTMEDFGRGLAQMYRAMQQAQLAKQGGGS